uniref:Major facilitator superfamily (MFS) profile domain-containing protein n=1 Tax=Romanomermis culicivorax TaxID=13658 RepID=A0A915J5V9_ROMCU
MTANYETISPSDQKSKMENPYKNESASTAGGGVKKSRHVLARYPKGVFFCLGNEFTERFSFYGMRAVLTFYLMAHHSLDESAAKLIFHLFVSIAYFTPLLGSILADGFLGRFKVILYFSVLYCVGHVLLTLGSLPIGNLKAVLTIVDFAGLFIIAVSTGGIKPCVSAFAADQFPPDMQQERKQFFSFFYFSINVGALLSQIVTPLLRGRVSCLGEQTCFPLAFGVPSIFMVLALAIFLCGTPFYKLSETRDNVIWE